MKDHAKTSKPLPAGKAENPDRSPGPATGVDPMARPAAGIDPLAFGLQRLFASVAEEAVPDDFMALLDRIEAAERERDADKPPTDDRASR